MPEIDHDLLRRLQLHNRPRGRVIFANTVLALDYRFPSGPRSRWRVWNMCPPTAAPSWP